MFVELRTPERPGSLPPIAPIERVAKPAKRMKEVSALVAEALNALGELRVMPPLVERHIRDGMGRNWDVIVPARTMAHRRAIDRVRDLYDLAPPPR
ncbi:MAG TPA: hypothetical protein VGM74_05410 [Burkholderiaceae bacterium]|jgi:hypothetical protein